MDLFETLHTCSGHIENVHVGFFVELELILTELQPIELSHFRQLLHCGYIVCVINSSYSFQWIILKPCILVFLQTKIFFDKITAFSTLDNFQVRLQRRVASLCNQLFPGFASNQFEILHRCYKHNEDVHLIFSKQEIFFYKITAFWTLTIFRLDFKYGVASFCISTPSSVFKQSI